MGSYFPGHSGLQPLTSHPEALYSHTIDPNISGQPVDDNVERNDSTSTAAVRYCSVRGCSAALPFDYPNKMCELCRGRHRTYASTKRAKRKQEKAMLGAQAGMVWLQGGGNADDRHHASSSVIHPATESESPGASQSTTTQYGFTTSSWDDNALDPQLFQQTSSSALAGALSMPLQSSMLNHYSRPDAPEVSQPLAGPSSRPIVHSSSADDSSELTLPSNGPSVTGPAQSASSSISGTAQVPQPARSLLHPKGVISAKSISEAAAQMEGHLPPRYCSIKGCKTLIPGESFFKMCEPCRDRYRNYGTTKRKKWKREKEEAVAEMEKMREEENKRRVENGLPPLSEAEIQLEWQNQLDDSSVHSLVPPSNAPRMCTVSHCREILPGTYPYLRCERHRIQNRHHSKLKRVRDKESKAQALEEWVASADVHTSVATLSSEEHDDDADDGSLFGDDSSRMAYMDPAALERRGIPPAARGIRRTNHVCSIKVCHNLLSPSTPWKMCDTCRARDRAARRIKALRENGVMMEPLPPRIPREKKEKKTSKKEGKKKAGGNNEPRPDAAPSDGSSLVFMDPLLPERQSSFSESPMPTFSAVGSAALSFVLADQEGNITEPPRSTAKDTDTTEAAPSAPAESAPPKKKKATKRKSKSSATATTSSDPSTLDTGGSAQTPQALPTPVLAAVDPLMVRPVHGAIAPPIPADRLPHQYPFPYYVPPYVLPPYPPYGMPHHLPPGYPREGYPPPPPMYPPPYPPYPSYVPPYGYPYPYVRPLTQGQPPDATAPPAAPAVVPPQQPEQPPPMSSMFTTFSARPEDVAQNLDTTDARDAALEYALSEQRSTASSGPESAAKRRKRRSAVDDDEGGTTKRLEIAGPAGGESAAVIIPNPSSIPDNHNEIEQPRTSQEAPDEMAMQVHDTLPLEERHLCSNKTCRRMLAASSIGKLCDHCKERMKKRAVKVRQRFKLEPRKLAASTGGNEVNVPTDDDITM